MDFSNVDLTEILFSAIPQRFQDFTPSDFEDFVAQLFRDQEYTVQQTKYSGDFGADLLIGEAPNLVVVQVKRYAPTTKVGVSDVNQLIGARSYYQAKMAIIVTTSSFTPQALLLCDKTDVTAWDWDQFLALICKVYFGGLDYYTFFEDRLAAGTKANQDSIEDGVPPDESMESLLRFEISEFRPGQSTAERYSKEVSSLLVDIYNVSGENLHVQIATADFVTSDHRQIKAAGMWNEYFSAGVLYAGTKATCGLFFIESQLPDVSVGSKLILTLIIGDNHVVRHFIHISTLDGISTPSRKEEPIAGGGPCYVVTFLYGSGTEEYDELICFRDTHLMTRGLGRLAIRMYYKVAPGLVRLATFHPWLRPIFSAIVQASLILIRNSRRG